MRKISFFAITIVLLVIIYSLINQIFSAFRSGDRLSEALEKLHQLQIKNQALKKSLKIAASPDFIEQQARNKLSLTKADEVVVVIPDELIQKALQSQHLSSPRLPNPLGWWQVFFK